MKIVGSHDEVMLLKLQCSKTARCEYCALQPFCSNQHKVETWSMSLRYTDNTYKTYDTFVEWTDSDDDSITYYKHIDKPPKHETFTKGSPLELFAMTQIPAMLITKDGDTNGIEREDKEHSSESDSDSDK